jgi:hypothetical protein
MAYQLTLGEDRYLRFVMLGDMDALSVTNFEREYRLYLDASTSQRPIYMIVFAGQMGKISSQARNLYMQINSDPRLGLVAIVNPPRTLRVLAQFILKATGRANINFFDSEDEAIDWIRRTSGETVPHGEVIS